MEPSRFVEQISFIEQMSEMKEKADKYDHLKQRYDQALVKIKEHLDSINKIVLDLNPIIKHRERSSKASSSPIVEYALKKLEMGMYVTLKDLYKEFPDANPGTITTIFYQKLKNINSKIQKRKVNGEMQIYL